MISLCLVNFVAYFLLNAIKIIIETKVMTGKGPVCCRCSEDGFPDRDLNGRKRN